MTSLRYWPVRLYNHYRWARTITTDGRGTSATALSQRCCIPAEQAFSAPLATAAVAAGARWLFLAARFAARRSKLVVTCAPGRLPGAFALPTKKPRDRSGLRARVSRLFLPTAWGNSWPTQKQAASMQQCHRIRDARDERPDASQRQQFADRQISHDVLPRTFFHCLVWDGFKVRPEAQIWSSVNLNISSRPRHDHFWLGGPGGGGPPMPAFMNTRPQRREVAVPVRWPLLLVLPCWTAAPVADGWHHGILLRRGCSSSRCREPHHARTARSAFAGAIRQSYLWHQ